MIGGPDHQKQAAKDKLGHLTIGYGFNLEAPRSEAFWEYVLEWDIDQAVAEAVKYDWFHEIDKSVEDPEWHPRQAVIISMIYQLGPTGFAGFKWMIALLVDWSTTHLANTDDRQDSLRLISEEMLNSKWARQTPERAQELAEMMRTGAWPKWMAEAA